MDASYLACKYRPLFYLHTNEKYRPIDFNESIKHYSQNGKPSTILSIRDNPEYVVCDHSAISGSSLLDLDKTPVYITSTEVTVKPSGAQPKKYYDFVYHQIYNYNGPTSLVGKMGIHPFDMEIAIVRVEVVGNNSKIVDIFLSRHSSGVWLNPSNFEFHEDRPVIYIAKDSHALYQNQGSHHRMFGFTNDKTTAGHKWNATCIYLDMDNLPEKYQWVKRKGKLTAGFTMAFSRETLKYTINHKPYHYSSADEITKKIGHSKQREIGFIFGFVIFIICAILSALGIKWYAVIPTFILGMGVSHKIVSYQRVQ
jgi:hypothetical protein